MKKLIYLVLIIGLVVAFVGCASVSTINDAEQAIHDAARDGNTNELKRLLDEGSDIEERGQFGKTPLYLAVENGHTNTVKFLLSQGANVDVADGSTVRPIYEAARGSHVDIVRLLLEHGANVNDRGSSGYLITPLHIAAKLGHKEVVELLIDAGAHVNQRSKMAISRGKDKEMILGPTWVSPLDLARMGKHTSIIELLIANGAEGEQRLIAIVMPFNAAPDALGSGEKMTEMFTQIFQEMVVGRYELIDPERVVESLSAHNKSSSGKIPLSVQDKIAKELNATVVISGRLHTWKDGNIFSMPSVGFEVKCRSVIDSTILCVASHSGDIWRAAAPQRKAIVVAPDAIRKAIKEAIEASSL